MIGGQLARRGGDRACWAGCRNGASAWHRIRFVESSRLLGGLFRCRVDARFCLGCCFGLLVVCLDGSRTMQANHRASKADSLCILFGSSPFMFANRSRTLGKLTPLRVSLRVSFRSFRVHCNAQGVVLGVTEKSLFRRPVVGSECPLRVIQRSSLQCLSILTGRGDDRVSRAISQPRIACEKWCEDADRGGSWT